MINDVYTGCRALFDHAISSELHKFLLICLFVIVPLLRTILSILKSQHNLRVLHSSSKPIPKKLRTILHKLCIPEKSVIVISHSLHDAFTHGFFNKKIIVSSQLIKRLTPRQLEAVILHEQKHVLNFHSVYLLITEMLVQTFFFIPLLSDLATLVKVSIEKQADNHAVSIQKTSTFIKRSLKKSLQQSHTTGVFPQFSYQVIDLRLNNLVGKQSRFEFNFRKACISGVSVILLAVFFKFTADSVLARTVGEKINCEVFECAYQCVSQELIPHKKPMTPAYFSPATF